VAFASWTSLVGWLAVVVGTAAAYLQFTRLRRRGDDGVSLATWTLFVVLALFWITYGVAARSWQLVVASTLALPLQFSILVRLRPWTRWSVVVRSVGLCVVCCLAPAALWGCAGAVLGAGLAGVATRTPQLIAVLRSDVATGVSSGSWVLGVVVSSLWVIYYVGARLWAVLVVTALAGAASALIAVVARGRQREASASAPA
jgi:uncharacterized protein with PQ loop repeat